MKLQGYRDMATRLYSTGARTWSGSRDDEGHRTYKITFRVVGNTTDGPATALLTPGLPIPGAFWVVDDDTDLWAWCRHETDISPVVSDGDPNRFWDVTFTFSTKPTKRCNEEQFDDPLLEPQRISGSFSKDKVEATHDRFGNAIQSSSHEQLRGPQIEFDLSRPSVKIEQNVPSLQLNICTRMVDTVNAFPLWGQQRRCIKLTNFSWEQLYYGKCYSYYKRTFEFDVNFGTWDRNVLDEGTKVLNGFWHPTTGNWVLKNINGVVPDPANPSHFMKFIDRSGNMSHVILNGAGLPAEVTVGQDTWEAQTATVQAFGTGFGVGDLIALQGGVFDVGDDVTLRVTKVIGSSNAVIEVEIQDPGSYTATPGNPVAIASTDGSGTGATFNLTWKKKILAKNTTGIGTVHIEKYSESDFLLLGIPTTLGPSG